MIHELLLGISGHPSALLSPLSGTTAESNGPLLSTLSPAERALLESLTQDLGEKNKKIRTNASAISSSHPSIVCRAVAAAILATHLASFQRRILEVETEILEQNASIVGAYNIVPLSAIAAAFGGWTRKLGWLWDLIGFIQAPDSKGCPQSTQESCTAAELLKRLESSSHTGFPDIEQMSLDLLKVAETAWLKQLSTWVLYGRYPTAGAADFFIGQDAVRPNDSKPVVYEYDIQFSLVPDFVTKATAQSILAIGKALNYIRDRQSTFTNAAAKAIGPEFALLPSHLAHLSSYLSALESPLDSSSFSTAIGAIRLSLSQNALQKLLPMTSIVQMLHILKDFFLIDNGEFAVSLITAADERLASRNQHELPRQKLASDLANMTIKEGEVSAVLARAWSTFYMLQSLDPAYDEVLDDYLDRARSLIRLSIKSLDNSPTASGGLTDKPATTLFDDLLLPSSTKLSLRVHAPMDLFLAPADVDRYASIHAYLLAIRRAHLRLSKLFLLFALRRDSPSPAVHTSSGSTGAVESLVRRSHRASQRTRVMRSVWATIGSAVFFLTEIGEYFQGEVVKSSWSTFKSWLLPDLAPDAQSTDASLFSSIGSESHSHPSRLTSSPPNQGAASLSSRDPETLTQAHRHYLMSLEKGLLLDNSKFTTLLRRFMTSTDHLTALMQRLDHIQQSLNLETDTGVSSAAEIRLTEADRLMNDVQTSCQRVSVGIQSLTESLHAVDAARTEARSYKAINSTKGYNKFVPWAGGGVDRLLLKFDYGSVGKLLIQQSGSG